MSGLSTGLRLRVAAALCLLPLGLDWGSGPGHRELGAQAPARVLLVFAAATFMVAAVQKRTQTTKRVVQAATGAIGVGLVLALADRAGPAVLCLAGALTLLFGLVGPRKPGVFVPAPLRR